MKFDIHREFANINKVCFGKSLPKINLVHCVNRSEMPAQVRSNFKGLSGAFAPWAGIMVVRYNRIKNKEISFANDLYTLVHEMLHYRLWLNKKKNEHNKKFHKRVERLFVKVFEQCYSSKFSREIVRHEMNHKNI